MLVPAMSLPAPGSRVWACFAELQLRKRQMPTKTALVAVPLVVQSARLRHGTGGSYRVTGTVQYSLSRQVLISDLHSDFVLSEPTREAVLAVSSSRHTQVAVSAADVWQLSDTARFPLDSPEFAPPSAFRMLELPPTPREEGAAAAAAGAAPALNRPAA